jgi:predicted permease
MKRIREVLFRLQPFFRRKKIETGLSEEIQSHIEMATEANIAAGMSPKEARYAALREFGGVEQIKERYRDERGIRWLEELFSDIRFAARSLRKSPGFTSVAVLTLALCIGANSAVFSVVHAILLKPYPWPEAERLVYVYNARTRVTQETTTGVTVPDYLDRRRGVAAFEEAAIWTAGNMNLSLTDSAPEQLSVLWVTPSLFSVLKVPPALGRTFSEEDARVGAANVVVLSDTLWRNRFSADPKIINTEIRLGDTGEPHLVVGVMPPAFYFPSPSTNVWLPLPMTDQRTSDSERSRSGGFPMLARLKPGATIAQAQSELAAIQQANAERFAQFKATWEATGFGGLALSFVESNVKNVRMMLWLVQGAVAALLLIGCANVASLLLARASARERELAIRAALGASRGRLLRHLLTESLLLFAGGALMGLLVASWSVAALRNLGVANLPRGFEVSVDFTAFAFTLVCAVLTGLSFGSLPAWSATRGNNADALKDAGARATASRRHLSLRSVLVVTEIALALMLLATAALLIKGFDRLQATSPGFVREKLITAPLNLSRQKYDTREKHSLFGAQLLERVSALPGVTSAAFANQLPFTRWLTAVPYEIEGHARPADQPAAYATLMNVSADYFKTMGIPLLLGRTFTSQDTSATETVAVIDKGIADRHWPGQDPIGKWLSGPQNKFVIVGVVGAVKIDSLEAPVASDTIYLSPSQIGGRVQALVVKTAVPQSQLAAALREAVRALDPNLALHDIKTMEARLDGWLAKRRTPMVLLAAFAGIALLLATIGVYGVLAFAVGQRRKEIGVRIALGATATNIVKMLLRQGAWLVGLGLVLGLGGYLALSTIIRKLLFSVETTDYAALAIAPATLALVALAACLIPARRATKVDPIVALRAE